MKGTSDRAARPEDSGAGGGRRRVRPRTLVRGSLRAATWGVASAVVAAALFMAQTWFWWQHDPDPISRDAAANALWARHQWVGESHSEAEYKALAGTLRAARISDVFFHAGPFEADGSIPPDRYAHAGELLAAMKRYAPRIRAQAYVGQIERDGGGTLDMRDAATRRRVLAACGDLLDAGFAGIHYDIEPVYPDDENFLDLLRRTHEMTRSRGRVLSVAVEQLTLVDAAQPVYAALLPRGETHYPARPTREYLSRVADQVDQVAIMVYDTMLPTESLVGRHYAAHTEETVRLIGDRVTVFLGVPTYRPLTHWAENLDNALLGVRRGLDALDRPPARPCGIGVFADWTTGPAEWKKIRTGWLDPMGR